MLIYPVQTAIITDGFGPRESIDIDGDGKGDTRPFHYGLDFAAPSGTPVHACASGRVSAAGWIGTYGNAVYIDHGDGFVTRYAHLLNPPPVTVGQSIAAGQQIGQVGSTGASTGPHLHLELVKNGTQIDPAPYLSSTTSPRKQKAHKTMMIRDEAGSIYIVDEYGADHLGDFGSADIANSELIDSGVTLYGPTIQVNARQRDLLMAIANRRWNRKRAQIAQTVEDARRKQGSA